MQISGAAIPRFESVTPRLPVHSIEDLLPFYLEQLGFQLGWKWGTPLSHANVCRDAVSLDLIAVPVAQGTAMAYIQIKGVDVYYKELRTRYVNVGGLGDRPYGMRDFEVVDPAGNRLAFGEPLTA